MAHIAYRSTIPAIFATGLINVLPASAGTALYDGSYSGPTTVTFAVSNEACGPGGDFSLAIKDGKIDVKWGDYPIKLEISEDGTFRGHVAVGKNGRRGLNIRGKIAGATLVANLRTQTAGEHLCSYHWSLAKQ
jgi:hypothetical protein